MASLVIFTTVTLLLFFWINQSQSESNSTTPPVAVVCSNLTASPSDRQVFVANFFSALDALTPQVTSQSYGSVAVAAGTNNSVYAFGECVRDLSPSDCSFCFADIKRSTFICQPFLSLVRGGRFFLDGCYIRYDQYKFFNESLSNSDKTVCAEDDFGGNRTLFRANVVELVKNLSAGALVNNGFLVSSMSSGGLTVYGLAQCWELVRGSSCEECLRNSVSRVSSCLPKEEGRALNAGCYMRYSTYKFYNNSAPADRGQRVRGRLAVILATVLAAAAILLAIATFAFFKRKKAMKTKREKRLLGAFAGTYRNSKLNFSYETLEKATNYFNPSSKLGQGASGTVYKGIMPNGQIVAVKRLFSTKQWVDQFFNEVRLISSIHHPNLVKLLGCSITGPESLLVYEFVPNQSLYDYFSAKREGPPLRWEVRYKIILGTAEGLACLHEESELRIIHRDIKLGNILLDEDFTPKIADFGLVRLFPEDKNHLSTGIAGTLGYMAPEYAVGGKLTEKADVYSFGVVVIEVVTGKRNSSFYQDSYFLLEMVWNQYGKRRLSESIDSSMEGEFGKEAAIRILQVGLLCIQASAKLRPSMSTVVKMLTDDEHEIPQPTEPPFMNCTSARNFSVNLTQLESRVQVPSQYSIRENFNEPRTPSSSNNIF